MQQGSLPSTGHIWSRMVPTPLDTERSNRDTGCRTVQWPTPFAACGPRGYHVIIRPVGFIYDAYGEFITYLVEVRARSLHVKLPVLVISYINP
jgi:hypothetical protein